MRVRVCVCVSVTQESKVLIVVRALLRFREQKVKEARRDDQVVTVYELRHIAWIVGVNIIFYCSFKFAI